MHCMRVEGTGRFRLYTSAVSMPATPLGVLPAGTRPSLFGGD